jgi:phage/plasmid-like protein (TIGR03299 family)
MSHEFVMGFFSNNEPAWHGLGKVLPAGQWPGKEEAMKLAGHDWKIVEHSVSADIGGVPTLLDNHKALFRADSGECLSVMKKTYEVIQNEIPYDMIEAVAKEGVKWHCGITLTGGRCVVVGYLPEAWTAPGDNSPTLPFLSALWSHDGTSSLRIIRTAIRVVCSNTRTLAVSEASKSGLNVTIKHSKNWRDYVDRARIVLQNTRDEFAQYKELASELAEIAVKQANVETFLKAFLPMPDLAKVQYSDRVENNVFEARSKVQAILLGPTTADAHRLTAYGLWQAGLEYLQHKRASRTSHSKLNRCILSEDRMAENLHRLVISCAK